MLTIFGRKPVLEVLRDTTIPVHKLHLAESNQRNTAVIQDIEAAALKRNITVEYHSKQALSRISRNSKQDQGVAADLLLPHYQQFESFFENYRPQPHHRFIAVDQVTNPQNLGMIIRSIAAAGVEGLIIPNKGSAAIGPLVIKASAGTLFQCPIIRCENLSDIVSQFKSIGIHTAAMSGAGQTDLFDMNAKYPDSAILYIMGNESEGVSAEISQVVDSQVTIPMANGVESLNVAVAAALVAFSRG